MRSRRVSLGAIAVETLLGSAPEWLAEAERAVLGADPGCPLADQLGEGDAAYWVRVVRDLPNGERERRTVGALAAGQEDDWLVWRWLAVDEAMRAFGYGGAAVPVVERAAKRAGLTSARVLVPASNGVALYFWLRLGYRVFPEGTWGRPYEGTWMTRSDI
jgi:GNAT superfamily N-acetyltransferase